MRMGTLVFFVLFTLFCAPALAYDWSGNPGDGSPENPYQISTAEQLMSIGSDPVLLTSHYTLTNDIIFDPDNNPSHVFTDALIAPDPDGDRVPAFRGHFDGQGHSVYNLKVIGSNYDVGMFGVLAGEDAEQVTVQNLTLVNPVTSGGLYYCGALAGRMEGCGIESCHVIGGLVSHPDGTLVGGLVGAMDYATAYDCTSSAEITGKLNSAGFAGGIGASAIVNCSASGNIRGVSRTAGLVGWMWAGYASPLTAVPTRIVNSCTTGTVLATGDVCGGLVAYILAGAIENCYSQSDVTGTSDVGGLIGIVELPQTYKPSVDVIRCYAAGDVNGTSYAGGLIGRSRARLVKDCYATGNVVNSQAAYVGGLIGANYSRLVYCFSAGRVLGTSNAGGLAGSHYGPEAFLCYWDAQASQTGTSALGIGLTTAQMKSLQTYSSWGDGVWVLDAGNDYPHLVYENTPGSPIVNERPYAGSGSESDPYQIRTTDDLVFAGRCIGDWDKCFVLVSDISFDPLDLTNPLVMYPNANFNKIGLYELPFTGRFNGQLYSILNLVHKDFDESYNGLFGSIEGESPDDVKVENLQIWNASLAGTSRHGGLAGLVMHASIINCSVRNILLSVKSTSSYPAANDFGGLIGIANNVTISQCSAHGSFSLGNRGGAGGQAGLVGNLAYSTVENSYAICAFATATSGDGGFTGSSYNNVYRNCYAAPSVAGSSGINGFVGYEMDSRFYNCYFRSGTNIWSGKVYMLTDTDMKRRASFTGWDFLGESVNGQNEIWRMCVDGVSYPRLSWEFAQSGDFACGDGVDLADLSALADRWLSDYPTAGTTFSFACDANGDDRVDLDDLSILGENWP